MGVTVETTKEGDKQTYPKPGDQVTMDYTGTLDDGTVGACWSTSCLFLSIVRFTPSRPMLSPLPKIQQMRIRVVVAPLCTELLFSLVVVGWVQGCAFAW